MITTGQLEEICQTINKEYGADTPVCILFIKEGIIVQNDYALGACHCKNGTLCLMNEPFEEKE